MNNRTVSAENELLSSSCETSKASDGKVFVVDVRIAMDRRIGLCGEKSKSETRHFQERQISDKGERHARTRENSPF